MPNAPLAALCVLIVRMDAHVEQCVASDAYKERNCNALAVVRNSYI